MLKKGVPWLKSPASSSRTFLCDARIDLMYFSLLSYPPSPLPYPVVSGRIWLCVSFVWRITKSCAFKLVTIKNSNINTVTIFLLFCTIIFYSFVALFIIFCHNSLLGRFYYFLLQLLFYRSDYLYSAILLWVDISSGCSLFINHLYDCISYQNACFGYAIIVL